TRRRSAQGNGLPARAAHQPPVKSGFSGSIQRPARPRGAFLIWRCAIWWRAVAWWQKERYTMRILKRLVLGFIGYAVYELGIGRRMADEMQEDEAMERYGRFTGGGVGEFTEVEDIHGMVHHEPVGRGVISR